MVKKVKTLGALKKTDWRSVSVKEEIRTNLLGKIKNKEKLFRGIYGFEETVEVQIVNCLLAKHNFILLGRRGQGKTKLVRSLVDLLDQSIPVIQGTDLNDDPYHPISPQGKKIVMEQGEDAPIRWIDREERFNEKLATPDVSVADLIGDLDPIKAARYKLNISSSEVIHWGIIPHSNRGIFAINELSDLQPRIQVSLFNILEEKDIQIRGFPFRVPLDLLMVFTANPEDYTNRGRIITPLKDRINSQIITHYPLKMETAKKITFDQVDQDWISQVTYPELFIDLLENISFVARESDFVDQFSGVSQRLSISALENSFSNVVRRCSLIDDQKKEIRLMDMHASIPSITGKIELIEEGSERELIKLSTSLIHESIKKVFDQYFPSIFENTDQAEEDMVCFEYQVIVNFFRDGGKIQLSEKMSQKEFSQELLQVPSLNKIAEKYAPQKKYLSFFMELILEGLFVHKVIHRQVENGYLIFNDIYSTMFQKL